MPPSNEPMRVNNVWAQSAAMGQGHLVTLPSGQTVRIKRIGLEEILASGLLGEADSLITFVDKMNVPGASTPDGGLNLSVVMKNTQAVQSLVMLVDRVAPLAVIEPVVKPHFVDLPDGGTRMIPMDKRDKGAVYTDQIGLQDKVFITQYAIEGIADLERFHGQSSTAVAALANGGHVPHTAQRASRNKPRRKR